MVIEHVAMYVNNLEKARDFFVSFLNGLLQPLIIHCPYML